MLRRLVGIPVEGQKVEDGSEAKRLKINAADGLPIPHGLIQGHVRVQSVLSEGDMAVVKQKLEVIAEESRKLSEKSSRFESCMMMAAEGDGGSIDYGHFFTVREFAQVADDVEKFERLRRIKGVPMHVLTGLSRDIVSEHDVFTTKNIDHLRGFDAPDLFPTAHKRMNDYRLDMLEGKRPFTQYHSSVLSAWHGGRVDLKTRLFGLTQLVSPADLEMGVATIRGVLGRTIGVGLKPLERQDLLATVNDLKRHATTEGGGVALNNCISRLLEIYDESYLAKYEVLPSVKASDTVS